MAQQFKDQGGAASMTPSPLKRLIFSKLATHLHSGVQLEKRRNRAEKLRKREGRPHLVEYFHQVDDAYSYLACQLLAPLCERYDVDVRCHLVRGPEGDNAPDAAALLKLARADAMLIADGYGLDFPADGVAPDTAMINLAQAILAAAPQDKLATLMPVVGKALWGCNMPELHSIAEAEGRADDGETVKIVSQGTDRRKALKHYSGAMFHYEGEWYWGIDRLHYLEARLAILQLDKRAGQPLLAPCPEVSLGEISNAGDLTLEFFPSLRSPYTSIVFDETVALAAKVDLNLIMRPVLPMVMRGVPATREKGMYIFADTAREARRRGVPYGRFYDPIGEPVRRCYSLYPWAVSQGRGVELLSSFLRHAFALGVNTNSLRGLKRVVEAAGLDWQSAKPHLGQTEWEGILESNRQSMYEAGIWGVPSYRLIDANGTVKLEVWGQDRLWLVAREIRRHCDVQ